MAYCPYGTQMQKGIIPVMEALGDKADIQIKWVDYVMHGSKEIDENLVQYCIQKGQPALYLPYINCFLEEGKSTECLQQVGVNTNVLDQCIQKTDTTYSISSLYEDKNTWSGGQFPQFNVHKDLNEEYGVRGSPTLIINGVTASVGRSPSEILNAVCTAFKDKPEECSLELSNASPSPGFGFGESTTATNGGCST